jgi:hypothetical protein
MADPSWKIYGVKLIRTLVSQVTAVARVEAPVWRNRPLVAVNFFGNFDDFATK